MNRGLLSVTIVTFNSAKFIRRCLEFVLRQDYPEIEVVVVDNASADQTVEIVREFVPRVRLVSNAQNVGFAEGQNQAIRLSSGDWILTLNPDVRLSETFASTAISAAACAGDAVGSVSGKLLAMGPDFEIPPTLLFDSTGIYFTPSLRHFDRGSKQPDHGQYDHCEYVFGVTGAAGLFRRSAIQDASVFGEFFDPDFFAYREDADVAWRLQLLGWKCLYVPQAVAYHVRSVVPSNRRSLPSFVNMHSVKNRFLMRMKNATAKLYVRFFVPITVRDLIVLSGCVLREWASVRAFPLVLKLALPALAKRRAIMQRTRVSHSYIAAWFSNTPVSFPAPELALSVHSPERMASR